MLGLQVLSQFRKTWGRDGAQTLLGCIGSWLILRAGDPETAEEMSKRVGDQQLRRPEESTTTSDNGESTSRSERVVLEKLLLPSEIMNMPNLAGVLCLGKDFLPVPVEIPLVKKDRRILPFVAKKHPALSVPAAAPADPAPAPAPSAAPVVQTAPVAAAPSIAAPDLD